MFLWSDKLGNFLHLFLGAFKQLCLKIFLVIDELWILEKFNDFNPLSSGCSSGRISLALFISFPGCIEAFVPKNFFGIRLTLNFGEIKRFQPPLQGMFHWAYKLGNFLYHFLGAFKQFCRKIFLVIDKLWILETFNDFNPLSRGCSCSRISLAIFYIISWVHSSNRAVKFFW